jgi:hypothetical protein
LPTVIWLQPIEIFTNPSRWSLQPLLPISALIWLFRSKVGQKDFLLSSVFSWFALSDPLHQNQRVRVKD